MLKQVSKLFCILQLCVILEPMQELMSRHKAYALSPRDCLKTTLFQKWQKMVAPPGTYRQIKAYSFYSTLTYFRFYRNNETYKESSKAQGSGGCGRWRRRRACRRGRWYKQQKTVSRTKFFPSFSGKSPYFLYLINVWIRLCF